MDDLDRLLAENEKLLGTLPNSSPPVRVRAKSYSNPGAVGSYEPSRTLDLEFFGTHYLPGENCKPRLLSDRPSEILAVVHTFGGYCEESYELLLVNYEVIHHHHAYNEPCYTRFKCHLITEEG